MASYKYNGSRRSRNANPIVSSGFIIFVIVVLLIDGTVIFFTLRDKATEVDDYAEGISEYISDSDIQDETDDVVFTEENTENVSVQEDTSIPTEEETAAKEIWIYHTFLGHLTDEKGKYPIELTFVVNKQDNTITNAIYKNVDLGGKIRMRGEIVDDNYVFTGKDGRNTFRMTFDDYSHKGVATDGSKELQLSFYSIGQASSARPPETETDDEQTENLIETEVERKEPPSREQRETVVVDDNLYAVSNVNVAPQFLDGGQAGLMQHIARNIQYPSSGNNIQGRVIVQFVIEKDGSVSNLQIVRSLDEALDKEACRIVKTTSGKWKPAQKNGNAIRVQYTLPIVFKAN